MSKLLKIYIITGAPGTGKTTVINLLKNTIPCIEEVSRKVIIEEQENNKTDPAWKLHRG